MEKVYFSLELTDIPRVSGDYYFDMKKFFEPYVKKRAKIIRQQEHGIVSRLRATSVAKREIKESIDHIKRKYEISYNSDWCSISSVLLGTPHTFMVCSETRKEGYERAEKATGALARYLSESLKKDISLILKITDREDELVSKDEDMSLLEAPRN